MIYYLISTIVWVHLEDVGPRFLHHMSQAEQMKQSFSHETFPLAVATQGLTDLGLVGFSRHLFTHRRQFTVANLNVYAVDVNVNMSTPTVPLDFPLQRGIQKIQHLWPEVPQRSSLVAPQQMP